MKTKKFRYIIFVFVFLLAVTGFLLYSFLRKNKGSADIEEVAKSDTNIPRLYNVLGD